MWTDFYKGDTAVYALCYKDARDEYFGGGVFFLNEQYIRQISSRYGLFENIYDELIKGADKIRSRADESIYCLFVYKAMLDRDTFLENLKYFTFPDEYEFMPLLCLIPFIDQIYDELKMRNVPQDIIDSTLGQFEDCVHIYSKRSGKLGLSKRYFDFLQRYVDRKILNINRLRFEIITLEDPAVLMLEKSTGRLFTVMTDGSFDICGLYSDTPPGCKEDFTVSGYISCDAVKGNEVSASGRCTDKTKIFNVADYSILAGKGDTCLSVHIPDKGDFSRKSCIDSYERAKEVFEKSYPELDIKAFHCESWMMASELADHLPNESKILSFASDYVKYPVHTKGEDVLNFVFYLKGKTISELPEDSSLQRSLKKLYLSGKRLYEYSGIMPY